jgi:hypothetical protein
VIQTALERCVGDATRFAEKHWGRRPLHRPGGDAEGFDDLLSLAGVDHLVSSAGLRLPAFRLVKDGVTVPSPRYTRQARTRSQPVTGLADPVSVYREFEGGATIVLQGLHRYWRTLAEFCRRVTPSR